MVYVYIDVLDRNNILIIYCNLEILYKGVK